MSEVSKDGDVGASQLTSKILGPEIVARWWLCCSELQNNFIAGSWSSGALERGWWVSDHPSRIPALALWTCDKSLASPQMHKRDTMTIKINDKIP